MRDLVCGARLAALALLGQGVLAGLVRAETAADAGSGDVPLDLVVSKADPADTPIDEIVVSGTRVLLEAAGPVTVLGRRDIERGGASSIGDVLQSLPHIAGSPVNTNVNMDGEPIYGTGRGDGSVRISLRGHDTLVLLNGRRFPNSGSGAADSVDLNTLPVSFVDRIEVLPAGASALYGTGAVGGVVNVITRRDGAGLTLSGSQTLSEHDDGPITTVQVSAGLHLFGGDWFVGAEYVDQQAVTLDRRGYSAAPLVIVDADAALRREGRGGSKSVASGCFLRRPAHARDPPSTDFC